MTSAPAYFRCEQDEVVTMTEQERPQQRPDEAHPRDTTGHPAVDQVLTSFVGLDERPVDEHVAVFERAHADLRAVLDDPGEGPDEGSGDDSAPDAPARD